MPALLTPPILLFFYRLASPQKDPVEAVRLTDNALVILNTVVLPVIGWIVARLRAPEYLSCPAGGSRSRSWRPGDRRRHRYANGRFNYRSLTCEDFLNPGDKPPANCAHAGHP